MQLYEATNGYIGESYVRLYVWAKSQERATELAREKFKNGKDQIVLELLFSSDTSEFCTDVSDNGWERNLEYERERV